MYSINSTNSDSSFIERPRINKLQAQLTVNWQLSVAAVILAMGALATLGYFSGIACASHQFLLNNVSFQLPFSMALSLTTIAAGLLARRTLLKSDLAKAQELLPKIGIDKGLGTDVETSAANLAKDTKFLVAHLTIADPQFIAVCCRKVDSIENLIQEISKAEIVENCPEEWRSNLKKNLKIVQESAQIAPNLNNLELLSELNKMISQLGKTR